MYFSLKILLGYDKVPQISIEIVDKPLVLEIKNCTGYMKRKETHKEEHK